MISKQEKFLDFFQNIKKNALVTVFARPSMGKTTLALSIAQKYAIEKHIPILIFSLEMTATHLTKRILCSEAELSMQHVKTGELNSQQWGKIADITNKLKNIPLLIDDTQGITTSEIKAKAGEVKQKYPNLGLIIIDYLQLIEDKSTQDRFQAISNITRNLKAFAHELSVPVFVLSQLPRRGIEDRKDKRPVLSDIKHSFVPEDIIDVILFMYRPSFYTKNKDTDGKTELIVAKNNYGDCKTYNVMLDTKIPKFVL